MNWSADAEWCWEASKLKVRISRDALMDALQGDSEFRVLGRYWTGSLRFDIGSDVYFIKLRDSEAIAVERQAPGAWGYGDVVITAPVASWIDFLQPVPRPLCHEFYPASAHHGFVLGGDPDTLWPYYYAIRRAGEIMRSLAIFDKE